MYKGPRRKKIRLGNYNYSQPGEYFITICTKYMRNDFGKVVNAQVELSKIGGIANECWQDIPNHFPRVKLDEYVVMPNHLHGIVVVTEEFDDFVGTRSVGTRYILSLQEKIKRRYQFIPIIIGTFKAAVTRRVDVALKGTKFSWQRSYFDHIITTDDALDNIREYIRLNPLNWENDLGNLHFGPELKLKERKRLNKKHYRNLFKRK